MPLIIDMKYVYLRHFTNCTINIFGKRTQKGDIIRFKEVPSRLKGVLNRLRGFPSGEGGTSNKVKYMLETNLISKPIEAPLSLFGTLFNPIAESL